MEGINDSYHYLSKIAESSGYAPIPIDCSGGLVNYMYEKIIAFEACVLWNQKRKGKIARYNHRQKTIDLCIEDRTSLFLSTIDYKRYVFVPYDPHENDVYKELDGTRSILSDLPDPKEAYRFFVNGDKIFFIKNGPVF